MKNYNTKLEYYLSLIGVLIHTFVALFIVVYLLSPDLFQIMIDTTTGKEQ